MHVKIIVATFEIDVDTSGTTFGCEVRNARSMLSCIDDVRCTCASEHRGSAAPMPNLQEAREVRISVSNWSTAPRRSAIAPTCLERAAVATNNSDPFHSACLLAPFARKFAGDGRLEKRATPCVEVIAGTGQRGFAIRDFGEQFIDPRHDAPLFGWWTELASAIFSKSIAGCQARLLSADRTCRPLRAAEARIQMQDSGRQYHLVVDSATKMSMLIARSLRMPHRTTLFEGPTGRPSYQSMSPDTNLLPMRIASNAKLLSLDRKSSLRILRVIHADHVDGMRDSISTAFHPPRPASQVHQAAPTPIPRACPTARRGETRSASIPTIAAQAANASRRPPPITPPAHPTGHLEFR